MFTRSPAPERVKRCTGLPLQATSWIGVPLVRVPPAGSMHLPIERSVPSLLKVQDCAEVPLQSYICRRVPSAGFAPGMSMQRLLKVLFRAFPVAGGGGGGVVSLFQEETR